jgi:2-polyprenyl-6-methoxyphenol hydroxylase-like FAD-dependent oxidoreductase
MSERLHKRAHAIVIGAGMAGLLTARILSEFYDGVTILERDTLPDSHEPRPGVPQGRHAHALLAAGQQTIETLFPGITADLETRGAPRGSGRFFVNGGYLNPDGHRAEGLLVSRPFLEATARRRLLGRGNIRIRPEAHVRGLIATHDHKRVTGVRVRQAHTYTAEEEISADLVVDASGRGSHAADWLGELGFEPPETELVEVNMGYSSRVYRREAGDLDGDLIVNIAPSAALPRACGMIAQEDDRWIVTLAGYFGNYPPTDDAGYLDFARGLPTPGVYDLISRATPLTDPTPYRFLANQRHHYERLATFPEAFLVTGDAICSFTPIYGQGMSVASLEALALRDCLQAGTERLAARFFQRASAIVDLAWMISAGGDRALSPELRDRRPPARFIRWYLGRLQRAAHHDADLATAFLAVANLLAPPQSLMRPGLAWRVLRPERSHAHPSLLPAYVRAQS